MLKTTLIIITVIIGLTLSTFNESPAGKPWASDVAVGAATATLSEQQLNLFGQIGGNTKAVVVQGTHAYLGVGPRVAVLDVTDPMNPTVVGTSFVLPGLVLDLKLVGSSLYVAAGTAGLLVLDVTNPIQPLELSSIDTPGNAKRVTIHDHYAFVADGGTYASGVFTSSGLRIIDVTDPSHPVEVGSCPTVGSATGVAVEGSYAFVGDQSVFSGGQFVGGGFRVIDISDLGSPALVGNIDNLSTANVQVSGNYAYAASFNSGLKVIDISNPMTPAVVGTFSSGGFEAYDVALQGTLAYLPGGWRGLEIIDVSNPTNPTRAGRFLAPESLQGIFVLGDRAYVAAEYGVGLKLINVANPAQPIELSTFRTYGYAGDTAVGGDYAYVTNSSNALLVLDVTNPSDPIQTGYVSYGQPRLTRDGIAVIGNLALVAQASQGLRLIDITEPSQPALVGFYDSPGSSLGVAATDSHAYLADGNAGLRVVDISNPANPLETGFVDTPGFAADAVVSNGFVYVADRAGGLRVIDVSTSSAPTEIGFYIASSDVMAVAVDGVHVYAALSNGLLVLDITDPATPVEVSNFAVGQYLTDISVATGRATITSGSGVYILDVTNPAAPTVVAAFNTLGNGTGGTTAGNLVYVSDYAAGLVVLCYGFPEDMDCSGEVDILDIQTIAIEWQGANPRFDLNGNGIVDVGDIQQVTRLWGAQ